MMCDGGVMSQTILGEFMTQRTTSLCKTAVTMVTVFAAATIFSGCVSTPVLASDYSHTCRSADGVYEMNDGSLYRSNADASSGQEITYKTIQETVLKRELGYCKTKTGKRYDFEFKSYTLRVAFKDEGQAYEFDMVCELAADGLPASEVCIKNVVTSSTGAAAGNSGGGNEPAPGTPAPGTQGWMHNGSEMKLIANGNKRRFVYEIPRSGLSSVGIKRGETVFEGTRDGNSYSGTAYIFKSGCDPQGYPVSGSVASDERSITMTGQRPKVASGCRVDRYEDDTLVFELPGDGGEGD